MTDKEAIKYLQQLYPNGGHCWLDEQRIEAIGMAIQALQEEPINKDFKMALTEMTDKVHKIREWISNEQDSLMDEDGYFEYPEDRGAYNVLSELDDYIDSLQEEKKRLHDIQNIPVDEEKLRNDRRNTV